MPALATPADVRRYRGLCPAWAIWGAGIHHTFQHVHLHLGCGQTNAQPVFIAHCPRLAGDTSKRYLVSFALSADRGASAELPSCEWKYRLGVVPMARLNIAMKALTLS